MSVWLHTLAVPVVGPLGVVEGEAGALAAAEPELARDRRSGRRSGPREKRGPARRRPRMRPLHRRHRSNRGWTNPYSGRGTYSRDNSTSPSTHVARRSRRCGAPLPSSCPRFPSPMARASVSATVPVGVWKVVSKTMVRSRYRRVTCVALGSPDRPVARFVTEKATEKRRAVEAWEAQPVDRPVPAHQRSAVPIRKKRIVGYEGSCSCELLRSCHAGSVAPRASTHLSSPREVGREAGESSLPHRVGCRATSDRRPRHQVGR